MKKRYVIAAVMIGFGLLFSGFSLLKFNVFAEKDLINNSTYTINLDPSTCKIDIQEKLKTESFYQESIDQKKGLRKISINGVANHAVGKFPNRGNPNKISVNKANYSIPLNPQKAANTISAKGYDTGVFFSGVSLEPFTAEFFVGKTGRMNHHWNITTLTNTLDLGLDCNNAHVQPTGRYHYHGTPSAFLADLGVDGKEMIKVGYAADGFPIYYKYAYDQNGNISALKSAYRLKEGKRPGDGIEAPAGTYNGRYFQDYEYVEGLSELDECNGRWGKTPEADHEYYYVVTDNFPSLPLCFSAQPSQDFQKHRGGPGRGRRGMGRRPPHRPRH